MSTYKRIFGLYTKHKWMLLILLLGIPVLSKLYILLQKIFSNIVDSIAAKEQWMSAVIAYVLCLILQFAMRQTYSIVEQRLSFKVIFSLRERIARKVLSIDSAALRKYEINDVQQMWNGDVAEIQNTSVSNLFRFFVLMVSAVLALIEIARISIWFPVIALIINMIAILPVKLIADKHKEKVQILREKQIAMNEQFYTIMDAIRLIKTSGKERYEIDRFDEANDEFVDAKLNMNLSNRINKSVITVLNAITPAIILLVAVVRIKAGEMTIGDVVLSTTLLATISQPFSEGGRFLVDMKSLGFKFERLFALLDEKNEDTGGKHIVNDKAASLEVKSVSYCVNDTMILDSISFQIRSGEKVAIVGESGSGKTTLINLLLRLITPSSGEITLNQTSIQAYDLLEYREAIHYSQSNVYLANASIMQNLVLLGAEEHECMQAARKIGFHDEICNMEMDYQTMVEENGVNLSGGQKKKIAAIRALTQKRKLYLFDEITRGMDETSAEKVMQCLMKQITETAVYIMHDFYMIEQMDRIIVMQAGKVVATGKHNELLRNCNYYRELYDKRKRLV